MRLHPRRRAATQSALQHDLSQLGHALEGRKSRAKSLALLAASGLAFTLPLDNRSALCAILFFAGVISALDSRFMPIEGSGNRESYIDLLLILSMTVIEPTLWFPGAIGVQASLAIHAIRLQARSFLPLATINIGSVVAVGFVLNQQWMYAAITLPLATYAAAEFGRDLRAALRGTRTDLESVLHASGAIAHLTDSGRSGVRRVLGDTERVTGWTAQEWESINHEKLVHPDDYESFWLKSTEMQVGRQVDRTGRMRRPDGSYTWIRDISRIEADTNGKPMLRGLSFDVTELEKANQEIRRQARHDELTGLLNRTVMNERMTELLDSEIPFTLFMLDMNRFKEINDTLGHQFGDDVLIEQSRRLTSVVRPDDLVVRLGGDEFAVISDGVCDEDEATHLAGRIGEAMAKPMTIRDVAVVAPTSIGVVIASDDQTSAGTLLRHADIAMYEAKRLKATVRFFTEDLERASAGDATLGAELIGALEDDQIVLHFQPKVDLATKDIIGAEGLARWEHPTRGLLAPGAFLHLLDVSESHLRFADLMITQAVACAKMCSDLGQEMAIAVNVSVRSLQDHGFPSRVLQTLALHRVEPRLLILEVTEQDLDDDNATVVQSMQLLADAGIEFAIDDFGTGFSSLERLRDLPVHELKVDQTFVQRAPTSSKDRVIAGTIIDMAEKLGHRVVAEGVETTAEEDLLLALGCRRAQGYIYGQAMDVHLFVDRVATEAKVH